MSSDSSVTLTHTARLREWREGLVDCILIYWWRLICVHTFLLLLTLSDHQWRVFWPEQKSAVERSDTLQRGNWSDAWYQAIWVVWLFRELEKRIKVKQKGQRRDKRRAQHNVLAKPYIATDGEARNCTCLNLYKYIYFIWIWSGCQIDELSKCWSQGNLVWFNVH